MMKYAVNLTRQDEVRYQQLQQEATADVLNFRKNARQSAERFPRDMRRLVQAADSRDAPIYTLFANWSTELAPEVESLLAINSTKTLQHTLAKQLNLQTSVAEERARQLIEERLRELLERFIDIYQGDASRRSYRAAWMLLSKPVEEITDIRTRFVDYTLHQMVGRTLGLALYDPYAPLLTRRRLARVERRQIKRYKKRQSKRLRVIQARQQQLKADHGAIISRIITLNLNTILVLDAYRQYQKRLDALKPASKTPAKTLSLFTATTKDIRDGYARTLTNTNKLSDIQRALKEVDNVLVEIFDMTNSERNALMVQLKEYRELEQEATSITTEQATHR